MSHRADTTIELTAIPARGYIFVEWSGDVNDTNASTTLVINCDTAVIAVFSMVHSTFAWWWLAAGVGAISVMLLAYLRLTRPTSTPTNNPL